MAKVRIIVPVLCAVASMLIAQPAVAAPKEPLIVTQLPDPDPNYVPVRSTALNSDESDAAARIEEAMQDFGRAIGQAALMQQQQVEARCKAGMSTNMSAADRITWIANCRYSRH